MLKFFDIQKYKNTNNTSHFKRFLMRVIQQDFNTPMFKKPRTEAKESINIVYFYTRIFLSQQIRAIQHFGIVFVYKSKIKKYIEFK